MSDTRVSGAPPSHARPESRKSRWGRWVFIGFQVVFLLWLISGIVSGQQTKCTGLSAEDCATAKGLGTTLGVGIIVFFWAAFDLIVGFSYLLLRLARRR